jgi:hypothetical protein
MRAGAIGNNEGALYRVAWLEAVLARPGTKATNITNDAIFSHYLCRAA